MERAEAVYDRGRNEFGDSKGLSGVMAGLVVIGDLIGGTDITEAIIHEDVVTGEPISTGESVGKAVTGPLKFILLLVGPKVLKGRGGKGVAGAGEAEGIAGAAKAEGVGAAGKVETAVPKPVEAPGAAGKVETAVPKPAEAPNATGAGKAGTAEGAAGAKPVEADVAKPVVEAGSATAKGGEGAAEAAGTGKASVEGGGTAKGGPTIAAEAGAPKTVPKIGAKTWQQYEKGIRGLYGEASFSSRQYSAVVDGQVVNGVADNVAEIAGKRVAVEAKFVDNWASSLRNPASPIGNRPFAVAEQAKVLAQARKYSAAFDEVIYHSNSPELIAHFTKVFKAAGIKNFRFILTE